MEILQDTKLLTVFLLYLISIKSYFFSYILLFFIIFYILIKYNLIKKIFLSLIIILTFFNHFTENTFKQFYTNIYPSKPEIRKTLKFIKIDFLSLSDSESDSESDESDF